MGAVGIVVAILGIVRALRERIKTKRPDPLCARCAFAHMQYASTGRTEVFCTFGGGVRPVKVDVMYCTDFCQRGVVAQRPQVGFALPVLEGEPEPAAALARE